MKKRTIHQWRDWILNYISEDNYELIRKDTLEVFKIVAKDAMEAENKSQLFIRNKKEEMG
ncbi:hypothetical protein [Desulfopila sp. IMCC35008]|uniref:hypothetical protein n=1 Tax=Desulfopila sp. IMCC35008 TaxID=2653858 RepID=UPI0013D26FE9|nr:hypothetical protein [Desulfopila sp. IMCC35008]